MAVRRAQRTISRKRSEYVYSDDSMNSTLDAYTSSDDNRSGSKRNVFKVRDNKSIHRLRKGSSSYEKYDDHAYTHSSGVKRLRKDTDTTTDILRVSKKQRCESKNAINARINRERKKAYLSGLEEEIDQLKDINKNYLSKIESKDAIINNLTEEVSRLKSLVANDKFLFALVSKISNVTGLPVSSSILPNRKGGDEGSQPRTRSVPSYGANHPISRTDVTLCAFDDIEEDLSPNFMEGNFNLFPSIDSDTISDFESNDFLPFDCLDNNPIDKNVGLCLHINQNRLSVEFCTLCNSRA